MATAEESVRISAVMFSAGSLLERCDGAAVSPHSVPDKHDKIEVLLGYFVESCRKNQLLCRQLHVLDSLLSVLETMDPQNLDPDPQDFRAGEKEMHGVWKGLKRQFQEERQQNEALIAVALEKGRRLQEARGALEELLHKLELKKAKFEENQQSQMAKQQQDKDRAQCFLQRREELEAALEQGRRNLQRCDENILQLKQEVQDMQKQFGQGTRELDRTLELFRELQGVGILSLSEEGITVQLRAASHTEPLHVSLHWRGDETLHVQMSSAGAGLCEAMLLREPLGDVKSVILEALHCYSSQASLLSDIQGLQGRFAIDWHAADRRLLFLKSASVVCTLAVEEGFPSRGQVQLVSVQGKAQPVHAASLRPPQPNPSLLDWLEFLDSSPDV
ncbi:uncharacterized protein si:dkey-225f5.4 isoform X1 [Acipenser ruthenus]|uniref:uncharacterized protein si:dkey-225f5.4 isoform X1 n=1 Tax=Acipenser ruthenus TaxID=7906 RepID=UPI002740F91D|nr:uncharacterized protein si:dkey-225f5.4 isoform X1 [Acipenser ruthenus]